MKIEKLNENKIKITFNIDDLEEKNIDLYSFMHNTPETQDLFWELLNEAEKECGFNVDDSMIYVEATTSGGGNFVLFVTKTNEKPTGNLTHTTNNKMKNLRLKKKTKTLNLEENICIFDSFDHICDFIQAIDLQLIGPNTLYSMDHQYYLKIANMPNVNILEYATICSSRNIIEAKIMEYGSVVIAENALQTIAKYFYKKRKKS